jgi:putative NADPH-quinone reductase
MLVATILVALVMVGTWLLHSGGWRGVLLTFMIACLWGSIFGIGKLVVTCVEAEQQHLILLKEVALTACVGQKRELFTYYGVKVLHDIVHSPLKFTANDKAAGVTPVPVILNTGTYTVTKENVDHFLKA